MYSGTAGPPFVFVVLKALKFQVHIALDADYTYHGTKFLKTLQKVDSF